MLQINRSADVPAVSAAGVLDAVVVPKSKRGLRTVVILLVVAVAGVAGWRALSRVAPALSSANKSIFVVDHRSFPVVEEVKGELKAKNTKEIQNKVEGRATIIWIIDEGTTVAEGDMLVKLASDQIEDKIRQGEATEASAIAALEAAEKDLEILIDENASNIRKADLALELAEIEKKKYIEGDSKQRQLDIQLGLDSANQSFERAKLDHEAAKTLHEKKFITMSELLDNEFKLHEAERAIEKAKISQSTFNNYEYPKELRKRESDVDEATKESGRVKKSALAKEAQKHADVEAKRAALLNTQNELSKNREQLANCEIKAPAPGLVVYFTGYRWDPQKIAVGSEIHERQTIVTLPDPAVMLVSVRIHEAKTHKIKLGQKVNVAIDAIPDRVFTGEISKIAPLADSRDSWLNPDLKQYETEITLDQTEPELKPGITARAEIVVSQQDNVLAVPLQAVYSKGGHHYVFRPDGGKGTPVEVKLGESSQEFVAIESGVAQNDSVMLAVSDEAKASLPEPPPGEAQAEGGPPKAPSAGGASPARRGGGGGGGRRGGGRRG